MRSRAVVLGLFGLFSLAAHSEGNRRVYRCTLNGQLTFSDRPCSGATDNTEIAVTPNNVFRGPEAVKSTTPTPRREPVTAKTASKTEDTAAAERARAKQQCARIAEQLETLQNKLRTGYSAKEDQKLHERQRQLQERQRTERCR